MFQIKEGDLPFVRTRRALLALDLQNDFVSSGAVLYADRPQGFLDQIIDLAGEFRRAGNIIWIRSEFETHRPVNTKGSNAEMVITDNDTITGCASRPSKKSDSKVIESCNDECGDGDEANTEREPYENEAFLSPDGGTMPQCVLPLSLGSDFNQLVTHARDTKDIIFTKTHYSAFKSGVLLQTLRSQFVTELFICGALTNISVYATAMDAARHGYTITLVEDCLGYRSKKRHHEALRKLTEDTGCELMSSAEVIEKIHVKENPQSRSSNTRISVPDSRDRRNIHDLMANLKLKEDDKACSTVKDTKLQQTESRPPGIVSDLKAKLKASEAEGPTPESDNSSDAAPPIPPQMKPSSDERKRVQSKVRSRRRLSKSNVKDVEKLYSDPHRRAEEMQEVAKSPLPPTHTAAAETLEKVPPERSVGRDPLITREDSGISIPGDNSTRNEADIQRHKVVTVRTDEMDDEDRNQKIKSGDKSMAVSELASATQEKDYTVCEGDSMIIHGLLSESEANTIFERVRDEVRWQKMSHQGGEVPRLVAVQGEINNDGSIPIYRHPADESPPLLAFTPAVLLIKSVVEKRLGHNVNHCLIQLYRSGTDYISEHSDKTLDIAPNSFIANVSLGAMRVMTFRTKKPTKDQSVTSEEIIPRKSIKAPLPHNSMCKMGLLTNMRWLHSIRQDKRATREKSEAELAFEGCRISLTFRLIGTFLDRDHVKIWGQGASAKEKKDAQLVINGETTEAEEMIWAFGKENHSSEFDWDEAYGKGFDVLHISNTRELFFSGDSVINLRILLILAEHNLPWTVGKPSSFFNWKGGDPQVNTSPSPKMFPIRLVDSDPSRARVQGDIAILLYLNDSYSPVQKNISQLQKARRYTRLQCADDLLRKWRTKPVDKIQSRETLQNWDIFAAEDLYIAGPTLSVADYAFWPVLRDILQTLGDKIECPNLMAYYKRMLKRAAVQKAVASLESIEVGNK